MCSAFFRKLYGEKFGLMWKLKVCQEISLVYENAHVAMNKQ